MPAVKTDTIQFEGRQFKRVIKVDAGGTFTTDLPAQVESVVGFTQVTSATLSGCIRDFDAALKRYREAKTVTRKVILYAVKTNSYIWDNATERVVFRSNEISFCKGVSVAVCAGIFNEREITEADGSVRYAYDYLKPELTGSMDHGANELPFAAARQGQRAPNRIEWSQEREEFFKRINRGLEAVILQLNQLNNPETVLALVEKGALFLNPPPEKAT